MPFQHEIFIPFHLVDKAGILFFGHVFTLAHQAFESYIITGLRLAWEEWFQNEEWIIPIKQTDASYDYPIQAGKACFIHLTVKEIRQSSFQLLYQFFQDEKLCCHVTTLHVFCERSTNKKRDIPSEIRSLLSNHTNF